MRAEIPSRRCIDSVIKPMSGKLEISRSFAREINRAAVLFQKRKEGDSLCSCAEQWVVSFAHLQLQHALPKKPGRETQTTQTPVFCRYVHCTQAGLLTTPLSCANAASLCLSSLLRLPRLKVESGLKARTAEPAP